MENFTSEFREEFNKSGFYANPKTTRLKLHTNDYDDEGLTIGNAVVMNMEIANEKIPVYSYNSDIFVKYLNGKNVITGVLALRKTTVDNFIALVYKKKSVSELRDQIEEKTELLKSYNSMIKEYTMDEESLTMYKEKIADTQFSIDNLKGQVLAVENEEGDLMHREQFDKSYDLLYYNDIEKNMDLKLTINFQDQYSDNITEIKNLLFVKKQTDINIGKTDIIEVYQFIGNPGEQ